MTLCECGCGQEVKIGNRFVRGHHRKAIVTQKPQICRKCGEKLTNTNWAPPDKQRYDYICKECAKEHARQWRDTHHKLCNEYARNQSYKNGALPMSESRNSSSFLGVYVTERVLYHIFKNIKRMPYGNPGYDFVCGEGYLIDAKSSCKHEKDGKSPWWAFTIRKNMIAQYFMLLAFDNRDDLNPIHVWMIPGHIINNRTGVSISESTINKWDEYRLDIDKVINCCNAMREGEGL